MVIESRLAYGDHEGIVERRLDLGSHVRVPRRCLVGMDPGGGGKVESPGKLDGSCCGGLGIGHHDDVRNTRGRSAFHHCGPIFVELVSAKVAMGID